MANNKKKFSRQRLTLGWMLFVAIAIVGSVWAFGRADFPVGVKVAVAAISTLLTGLIARKTEIFSRRGMTLLWMVLVAVIVGILIGLEQISILYVFATFAIIALLLIVGFADLEAVSRVDGDNPPAKV